MARIKTNTKVSVLSDLHAPDHDEEALEAVESFHASEKPHIVVANGDWLDGEGVSSHPSDGSPIDELDAITECSALLERFKVTHWIDGNHEYRYYRPANVPKAIRRLCDHRRWLELNKRGIKYFPFSTNLDECFHLDGFYFLHKYKGGVHGLRQNMKLIPMSCTGDSHRPGMETDPLTDHVAFNSGCLRTLRPEYMRGKINNWQHAFCEGEFRKSGSFRFAVHIIERGKIVCTKELKRGQW